jgi:polyhydroxybutyrate depolymerase
MRRLLLLSLVLALPVSLQAGTLLVDAGRGPIVVHFPSDYSELRHYPLVVNLHGYTNTGAVQEAYFQLAPLAESREFLYAYPTGTSDAFGNPFWNATDACCDLFNSGVDDAAYLLELIRQIRLQLNVDVWRVHFVGHSNGGFMSYRMACDHADVVASIGSLAGATFLDPADCTPVTPVHVLQVHGTNDATIGYNGGSVPLGGPYPGAVQTVETWAAYNGCSPVPDLTPSPLDLDAGIPGAESDVSRYEAGCAPSGSAELWTIPGGPHSPSLTTGFREGLVDFVLGHRKAGLQFVDGQTLVWPPIGWATEYSVYRGGLSELVDGPVFGFGECVSLADPDPNDTTFVDAEPPPSGDGFFYLAGHIDSLTQVESMLGSTSAGETRWAELPCSTP